MPVFWLTSDDGSVNFKCETSDAGQAFELLARSLRYNSFAALSADLGYTPGDFRVALLQREVAEYDHEGNRLNVERQRDNAVLGAFKHALRLDR